MDEVAGVAQYEDTVLVVTKRGVIYEIVRDRNTRQIEIRVLGKLKDLM